MGLCESPYRRAANLRLCSQCQILLQGVFLQASEVVTLEHAALPEAEPQPSGATSVPVVENVFTHVGQRVEVGGFEFSPPEELPRSSNHQPQNSATPWMLKFGEFVQRRVSQAGAIMTPILEGRPRSTTQVVTLPSRPPRLFFTRGRTRYGAVGQAGTAYAHS